jgi:hypothetical protein
MNKLRQRARRIWWRLGYFTAHRCDLDGPLNVEIREATEPNASLNLMRESGSANQT